MDHQNVRRARGQNDRREIRHVVGQFFEQRRGPDRVVVQEQRVAIGIGGGDVLRGNGGRTAAVLDDEGLAEQRGEALSEHARGVINAAAGRGSDDAHGLVRVGLRVCDSGTGEGERGQGEVMD